MDVGQDKKACRLLKLNEDASKFYYQQAKTSYGKIGQDYFKRRKLTDETISKFGLGFSGKSGIALIGYLRKLGYSDSEIIESGLADDKPRIGMIGKFWNRVMFPIQDINHRVIGFGGRIMGDGETKYLNSPETPVFDKRRNLYGLNFARTAKSDNIILCEGYMDVIALHQAGFTQAVASLGTALTIEQVALLQRYTDKVLIAYDSDRAGTEAAIRAIFMLKSFYLTGKVINLNPYKDPDEFIKNLGSDAFQEQINQAEDFDLFIDNHIDDIEKER